MRNLSRHLAAVLTASGLLLCQNSVAETAVEILDPQTRQPLSMSASAEVLWNRDKTGAERLLHQVTISTPAQATAVKGKASALRKNETTTSKMVLITDALSDVLAITYADGKTQALQLQLRLKDDPVILAECQKFGIDFKPAAGQPATPFYVAVKCVEKNEMIQVWITTPRGIRWIDTSIPEFQGKGAATRGFEINVNTKTEANKVGEFVFQDASGNKFAFALTLEQKSLSRKTAVSTISMGLASLGQSSGSYSASKIKPHVGVSRESRAVSPRISLGARIESTFPSFDSTFVKLSGIHLYGGYLLLNGASLQFEPRVFLVMEDASAKKGNTFVTAIMPALGAKLTYRMGKAHLIGEAVLSLGGDSSILGVNVVYALLKPDEQGELAPSSGFYLDYTTFKVSGTTPVTFSAPALGYVQYF